MDKKLKYSIIVTIIAILSIGINSWFIYKYSHIKNKVDDVVDTTIDEITDNVNKSDKEIQQSYDETIDKITENIEKHEEKVKESKPLIKEDTKEEYIKVKIEDKEIEMLLSNDIDVSHKQSSFLADNLNFMTDKYNVFYTNHNKMVLDLNNQLKLANDKLKVELTDSEMNQLVENKKERFFKFGIDLYVSSLYPIDQIKDGTIPAYGRLGGGLGLNLLFDEKLLIRGGVGLQKYDSNKYAPQINLSIGWFF